MIALERAGSVIEGSDHDHGLDKLDHRRVDFAKTGVILLSNLTVVFHGDAHHDHADDQHAQRNEGQSPIDSKNQNEADNRSGEAPPDHGGAVGDKNMEVFYIVKNHFFQRPRTIGNDITQRQLRHMFGKFCAQIDFKLKGAQM